MQTPPPYSAPSPRRNSTGMIIVAVIGGIALCCVLMIAALGGGGYWAFNQAKPMMTCIVAFQDLQKAVLAYAKDHNGTLPKAATWQTDVLPYYRTQSAAHTADEKKLFSIMPSDGAWGCETPKTKTGIAFNVALSGKKLSSVENPETTVLLFETDKPVMNANGPYKVRPANSGPAFVMGSPRPWIEVTVSGESNMRGANGQPIEIKTRE